ncbi:MAG TPA: TetR family transcriptional regulator [Micromonosporaceae bacterium]
MPPRDLPAQILDAAGELLVAHGFRKLRMQDVAERVGVSRQTVYNEFGDKTGLAQALVLRETNRLLDGIDAALSAHDDTEAAVAAAVAFVLGEGSDSPLVKAALTGDGSVEFLPLLTTRGEPVFAAAMDRLATYARRHWPHHSAADIDLAAEVAVRLTVSHLMLPLDPVDRAAAKVARAVTALLRRA